MDCYMGRMTVAKERHGMYDYDTGFINLIHVPFYLSLRWMFEDLACYDIAA